MSQIMSQPTTECLSTAIMEECMPPNGLLTISAFGSSLVEPFHLISRMAILIRLLGELQTPTFKVVARLILILLTIILSSIPRSVETGLGLSGALILSVARSHLPAKPTSQRTQVLSRKCKKSII